METNELEDILALFDLARVPLAVLLLVVGWLIGWAGSRLLDDLGERFTDQRLRLMRTKALMRFGLYAVLALVVPLSILRDSGLGALVPILATLGLGLGFAFKDVVASLVAGVILLVDEPFQVGDRVTVGEHYGEVKEIGLRSVRLVTLDDNLITIPNSRFLTDAVASGNAGALDMMVVVSFSLALGADVDRARRIVEEVAATSPYVYLDKPVFTVVSEVWRRSTLVTEVTLKAYVFDVRFEKAFQTDLVIRGRAALMQAFPKHGHPGVRPREAHGVGLASS